MKAVRTVALAVAAFVAGASPAVEAHAMLDHAVPAVGSTVASSPATIELTFTEGVMPADSIVEIRGVGGGKIATKAIVRRGPRVLVLPLPPLAPGEYTVHWKVVSVDMHGSEGTFRFRLQPP